MAQSAIEKMGNMDADYNEITMHGTGHMDGGDDDGVSSIGQGNEDFEGDEDGHDYDGHDFGDQGAVAAVMIAIFALQKDGTRK